MVTIVVALLLGSISVGSPTAVNGVVSLTVAGLYASYFAACALLLCRHLSGSITSYDDFMPSETSGLRAMNLPGGGGRLTWGPWRIREPFGTIINLFACSYLLIVFFFSLFPPATQLTPATMNYACLVFGLVMIMSIVYYVLVAHRVYKGPVIDETVRQYLSE